jgi:hypothetical protein
MDIDTKYLWLWFSMINLQWHKRRARHFSICSWFASRTTHGKILLMIFQSRSGPFIYTMYHRYMSTTWFLKLILCNFISRRSMCYRWKDVRCRSELHRWRMHWSMQMSCRRRNLVRLSLPTQSSSLSPWWSRINQKSPSWQPGTLFLFSSHLCESSKMCSRWKDVQCRSELHKRRMHGSMQMSCRRRTLGCLSLPTQSSSLSAWENVINEERTSWQRGTLFLYSSHLCECIG